MLSELGKYGASFVLVTQSLAKLDAIDEALRPTVFSNVDGLTVFQVSAQDARYLAPELGAGLEVEDLTALDDFECYARWWADGRRLPTFSLRLDPPPAVDRARVAAVAARSAEAFGRPRDEVAREIEGALIERGAAVSPFTPATSPGQRGIRWRGDGRRRPAYGAATAEGQEAQRASGPDVMDVLDGDTRLQTDALGWLARLPFLGAEELALLLGTTKLRATAALRALDALGWVEWVRASSPELVEGYGCLRRGRWHAPFFVAWDRAGAPPFHRRRRVSAWYAFREGDHAWGHDDIPPVLVVCASEAEADQWVRAVLAACDRRQTSPLPVFIAHVIPTLFESPLGPVWRRAEGTTPARLCERLTWRSAVPAAAGGDTALSLDEEAEAIPSRGLPLREWAVRAVETLAAAGSGVERLAALALATAPGEKRALEWLGHHPLLSTEELAVALGVWEPLAARLLERLDRYGLARFTKRPLKARRRPRGGTT